jgi:hypothetical protein
MFMPSMIMFYAFYLLYLCIPVMIFTMMNMMFTSSIKQSLIPAGLLVEPILGFLLIMLHCATFYKNLCSA